MRIFVSDKNRSDEELIQRFQQGNERAFAEIFDRYYSRLLAFVNRVMHADKTFAKDIAQNVFVKIAEQPNRFDTSRNFKSWVFTVTMNECRKQFRQPVAEAIDTKIVQLSAGDSSTQIDEAIFSKALKVQIDHLSYDHKTVFVLRYQEQFSIRDISAITNASEGTVKSRLHYAIKNLARELKEFHPHYQSPAAANK